MLWIVPKPIDTLTIDPIAEIHRQHWHGNPQEILHLPVVGQSEESTRIQLRLSMRISPTVNLILLPHTATADRACGGGGVMLEYMGTLSSVGVLHLRATLPT